jgi:hypothetical protein
MASIRGLHTRCLTPAALPRYRGGGQAPYVFLERLNGILDIHHTRDILDILVDILGILVGSRDILGMDLAGNKAEGTRKMGAD